MKLIILTSLIVTVLFGCSHQKKIYVSEGEHRGLHLHILEIEFNERLSCYTISMTIYNDTNVARVFKINKDSFRVGLNLPTTPIAVKGVVKNYEGGRFLVVDSFSESSSFELTVIMPEQLIESFGLMMHLIDGSGFKLTFGATFHRKEPFGKYRESVKVFPVR